MKAVLIDKYGGPEKFRIGEHPEPSPKAGEVKIRMKATSINPINFKVRGGVAFVISGLRFPKILGSDFAGIVEQCGEGVSEFVPGDEVYGFTNGATQAGALAEVLCCKASIVSKKPVSLNFEEAAAVPLAASTAYQALSKLGGMTAGMKVLVIGATGGVGHYAVQLAKIAGAHVTGVCRLSGEATAKALGCDEVIAYDREDFLKSDRSFDLIFDAAAKSKFGKCRSLLTENGTYVTTVPSPSVFIRSRFSQTKGKKARFVMANSNPTDLGLFRQWSDEDRLKPLLEAIFSLEETRQAFELAESGKTRGKVVIRTV